MIPDLGVPDSVQALFVLIAFFMPGFIAGKVFDLSFPRPHIPERVRLLEYLTLSFANYGAWSWLVVLVIVGRLWYAAPLAFAASAVVVLFVSPAALAMGMAWAAENRYFQRLAQRFGINAPHHIGTAWEWFFREHQGRRWWVVARLRSGIRRFPHFSAEFSSVFPTTCGSSEESLTQHIETGQEVARISYSANTSMLAVLAGICSYCPSC